LQTVNRRRLLIALAAGAFASSGRIQAQQSPKVWRVGFLAVRPAPTPASPDPFYEAFLEGMRDLGYVQGSNLMVEWRFAGGEFERLPTLAAELVAMEVEVAVTHSTPGTLAMHSKTKKIPIVSIAMGDPVASGVAKSLERPEGNVTGLALVTVDAIPKQLELLREMAPKLSRVAVLLNPASESRRQETLKAVQGPARQLGVQILPIDASVPAEIERAFDTMKQERVDAVLVWPDAYFIGQRRQIAALALDHRIPSMYSYREHVVAGGLASYGQNIVGYYRRGATYVDRILKGTMPAEMPFELATKVDLTINRGTAKKLGIAIPNELRLRADEVIG
jgi:putative ABC transport system substrate-binding protein